MLINEQGYAYLPLKCLTARARFFALSSIIMIRGSASTLYEHASMPNAHKWCLALFILLFISESLPSSGAPALAGHSESAARAPTFFSREARHGQRGLWRFNLLECRDCRRDSETVVGIIGTELCESACRRTVTEGKSEG